MRQQPLSSEDLLTDLMYLRKGEGMTPRRLSHAGLVDQILRSSAEDSYELKKAAVGLRHSVATRTRR